MAMITLTPLVIKPHDANAIPTVNGSIFVTVIRRWNGYGHLSNHPFNNAAIFVDVFEVGDQRRLHVGYIADIFRCCQYSQQSSYFLVSLGSRLLQLSRKARSAEIRVQRVFQKLDDLR
jgi:hypothetical protein